MKTSNHVSSLIVMIILLVAGGSAMAAVVADYTFDTPAGVQATDSSGNGNHGTLIGFPDYTSGYGDNPANPGYTSDGKIRMVKGTPLEYIQTSITAYGFLSNSFTIEAITGLHDDSTSWQPLVAYVCPESFTYWGSHGSKPHWNINEGGPWKTYHAYDGILADGDMHHYAITYDATATEDNIKMYLDGSLIATEDADLSDRIPTTDTGTLLIGSHMGSSSTEVWNGLVDRVRFSDNVVAPADFIPEPATISLLVLGGLGIIRRRRR